MVVVVVAGGAERSGGFTLHAPLLLYQMNSTLVYNTRQERTHASAQYGQAGYADRQLRFLSEPVCECVSEGGGNSRSSSVTGDEAAQ